VADTKHLDTALSILKGKPGSKRAKGSTFTLTVSELPPWGPRPFDASHEGLLQGPRGKTVAVFWGTADECKEKARQHVARIPAATLTIYD
jgi:hypothetical protein